MIILLTILSINDWWDLTWKADPQNAVLQILYDCPADAHHPPFWALNEWFIEPEDEHGRFHRVSTPVGQWCQALFFILRGRERLTEEMWVGETGAVVQVEEP